MSSFCCTNAPRVYANGRWSCSECGSIYPDNESDFSDVYGGSRYKKEEPKCECGADTLFGKGNGMHSAIMPCPLYKKPY